MKKLLLDYLVCPRCEGSLESDDGRLTCAACDQAYSIERGVPVLLDDEELAMTATAELYSDLWKKETGPPPKKPWRGYDAPAKSHLDLLQQASGRDLIQGKIGIDAGCGPGGSSIALADQHPETHFVGVDLSAGPLMQADAAEARPNLHFVRGNLLRPPFAREKFDFAFSFGVLHHTPAPEDAFKRLLERLRPGGQVTIFLYKDFSDLPAKRLALRCVNAFRRITTRMPVGLLRGVSRALAPVVFFLLTLPARVLRLFGATRLATHIPYGTFPTLSMIASSLEDRFGAPYEFRFSRRDLEGWASRAGLTEARVVDCIEWGFSGLVLSGFKPAAAVGATIDEQPRQAAVPATH